MQMDEDTKDVKRKSGTRVMNLFISSYSSSSFFFLFLLLFFLLLLMLVIVLLFPHRLLLS